jgi:hypothetical protein
LDGVALSEQELHPCKQKQHLIRDYPSYLAVSCEENLYYVISNTFNKLKKKPNCIPFLQHQFIFIIIEIIYILRVSGSNLG